MQQQQCRKFIANLQRFRLITFDVTDTLLRFRHPVSLQYKLTAEQQLGITGIDEQQLAASFRSEFKSWSNLHPNFGAATRMPWQQWWQQLVERVFATTTPHVSVEQRTQLAQALVLKYRTRDCWRTIDGGRTLIERLRACDKRVGVISNFDDSLEIVLREMELLELFDFVLTSYAAGVQKPHKAIFEQAAAMSKAHPDEVLHIGNSYELDYLGARKAGGTSVLVVNSGEASPTGPPAKSVLAYGSLLELLRALDTEHLKW